VEAYHLKASTAKRVFILVPMTVLITSIALGLIIGLVRINSATTKVEFENPDRLALADLDFAIENQSADGRYDIKVGLRYYVQVNISRPTVLSMLISGDHGSFQVPSANMQDAGQSVWFFWDHEITSDRYQGSTFQFQGNVPIIEGPAGLFPWDSYSSPTIYFWANFTIYPRIRIVSNPPQGFVWNLEPLGLVSAAKVTEEIHGFQRLFMAPPLKDAQPIAFRITLLRETASFLTSAFYVFAGIMIAWLAGSLARTGIPNREQRIPALIGMAIAALAFSWSFRQIAPVSPTLAEVFVIGIAVSWLMLEAIDVLRTGS
jgi:hypothetical protein